MSPTDKELHLSGCRVDLDRSVVHQRGEVVHLTAAERALMQYLIANPSRTIARAELLREVWGYAEGVSSRAPDICVARLRAKIELPGRPPVHLLTIRGEGYRFEPRAPARVVRAFESGMIGRESLVKAAREGIERGGLLTLLGPPGVGKTRLAQALCRQPAEGDGAISWWDLEGERDPDGLAARGAEALDLRSKCQLESLGDAVAEAGLSLLVLDGFEGLADVAGPLIATWVHTTPGLSVLVTSRSRLNVAGESTLEVPPLSEEAAVSLLLRRAQETTSADSAGAPDAALRALVRRLDCLPLAIEIAAPRLRLLGPEALLSRLEAARRTWSNVRRDAPARHASLFAAIGDSWELLSPHQRALLAQCAVFEAPFDLEAAEAVLAPGAGQEVVEALEALTDRSLLQIEPRGGEPRLRMLASVGDFVRRAPEQEAAREAAARHAAYFVGRAEAQIAAAERERGEATRETWALHRELLAVGRRRSNPELALRALLATLRVFAYRLPDEETRALTDDAVALSRRVAPERLDDALRQRAMSHWYWGRPEAARRDIDECIARSPPDDPQRAEPLFIRGIICHTGGDVSGADTDYRAALSLFRAARDDAGAAKSLINLAILARWGLRWEEGRAMALEALCLARRLGHLSAEARARATLARHERARGNLEEAVQSLRVAAAGFSELGLRSSEALSLLDLAGTLLDLERHAEVDEVLKRVSDHAEAPGMDRVRAIAAGVRADVWLDRGELEAALRGYTAAAQQLQTARDGPARACALQGRARASRLLGRAEEAEWDLREALDQLATGGDRVSRGPTLGALAIVQAELGRVEAARESWRQAEREAAALPEGQRRALLRVQAHHLRSIAPSVVAGSWGPLPTRGSLEIRVALRLMKRNETETEPKQCNGDL